MTILKRQGDLLFEQVDSDLGVGGDTTELSRPRLLNPRIVQNGVIERGETTGHAHRLIGGDLFWHDGRASVIAAPAEGAQVVHEEHDTVELEPGVWLVHRQVEYTEAGELAQVYD